MSIEREQRLYDALKRIASYDSPVRVMKAAERLYGLRGHEAVEMAYENLISEAKAAIKGMRRPGHVRKFAIAANAKVPT